MQKPPLSQSTKTNTIKTKQDIADMMGIHINTLRNRLKKVGINVPRGCIFPAQVDEILKALGWPPE